jgi:hypothetical protein
MTENNNTQNSISTSTKVAIAFAVLSALFGGMLISKHNMPATQNIAAPAAFAPPPAAFPPQQIPNNAMPPVPNTPPIPNNVMLPIPNTPPAATLDTPEAQKWKATTIASLAVFDSLKLTPTQSKKLAKAKEQVVPLHEWELLSDEVQVDDRGQKLYYGSAGARMEAETMKAAQQQQQQQQQQAPQ